MLSTLKRSDGPYCCLLLCTTGPQAEGADQAPLHHLRASELAHPFILSHAAFACGANHMKLPWGLSAMEGKPSSLGQ